MIAMPCGRRLVHRGDRHAVVLDVDLAARRSTIERIIFPPADDVRILSTGRGW